MYASQLGNGASRHAPYPRGRPAGQRMSMANTNTTAGASQRSMAMSEVPMSEMPMTNTTTTTGANQRTMAMSGMPMKNTTAMFGASQRAMGLSEAFGAEVDMDDLDFSAAPEPRPMHVTRPGSVSAHMNESLGMPEGMESCVSRPPSDTRLSHFGFQSPDDEARLPESMDRIANLMSQLVELHTQDLTTRAETNELLKQLNISTANVSQNTAKILQSNANLSQQLSQTMNKLKAVDAFTDKVEGFMHENRE